MGVALLEDMSNPMVFVLWALLAGGGFVLLAKIYGLLFMNGKSPHRVGEAMNVNRSIVTEWSGDEGYVDAGGELWRATSAEVLSVGDKVKIVSMNGLVLKVRKQNS